MPLTMPLNRQLDLILSLPEWSHKRADLKEKLIGVIMFAFSNGNQQMSYSEAYQRVTLAIWLSGQTG